MKKYFYSDGKERFGPYSFEELKNEDISKETLIWFEGLEYWIPAKDVEELEEILRLKPPPINMDDSDIISNKNKEPITANEGEPQKENKAKEKGIYRF